jgi:hypothetical protein
MAYLSGQTLVDLNTDTDPAEDTRWLVAGTCTDNSPQDLVCVVDLYLSQSGGATSPTAALLLQASPDGEAWFTLARVATTGSTVEDYERVTVEPSSRMRVKLEVGGATAPAVEARCAIWTSGQASFVATLVP